MTNAGSVVCFGLLALTTCVACAQGAAADTNSAVGAVAVQSAGGAAAVKLKPLAMGDVIELHKAQVDDSVVIARLSQQNTPMQLSVDELIALRKEGVSDAVVRTMIAPGAGDVTKVRDVSFESYHSMTPTGATAAAEPGAEELNNPLAAHPSGIYLEEGEGNGAARLEYIERVTSKGESMGGMLSAMATFGVAPMWMKYDVANGRAALRTTETRPVFYFYFDHQPAGLGRTPFAAAVADSPNQFQLEKLNANKKQRQVLAAKVGITGAKVGGNAIEFEMKRLRDGVYRVQPKEPLKPGEYCFILQDLSSSAVAGQTTMPKPDIFDFGVDAVNVAKK